MYIQLKTKAVWNTWLVIFVLGGSGVAQTPRAPTFDPAIPFSAFIREDLFAGFIGTEKNGDERFLRGEKNLEILLAERPQDRPALLAWKGGIAFKRAVDAIRAVRNDEFEREYERGGELYAEAGKLAPDSVDVMALTGAGYALFSDQFPDRYRKGAWEIAYKAYSAVWQVQGPDVEQLPLHFKGELLAGMAQAAQRTGRRAESTRFLEKILVTLPGTPYAAMAKKWTASPGEVGTMKLICQTCHDAGRLEVRRSAVAERAR
jgi:hypothetical protein